MIYRVLGCVLMVSFLAASSEAQPGRRGSPGGGFPMERFNRTAPDIGEPMPDVVVHDATGREVRLRELLEGHYSVIVLGCFT